MRRLFALFSLLTILVLLQATHLPGAHAQGFRNSTVTLQAGDWQVFRTPDPMSDKASCTGIYRGNFRVQLVEHKLYLGVIGGIESVTLRFGDQPAQDLRLPTQLERGVRAVIIEGAEFAALQSAPRLRYRVGTLINGLVDGDIDLTALPRVLEHIRAGCPATGPETRL